MHIAKPTLVDRGDSVALTTNITCQGRTHPVWFSVAPEWARYLDPECLDPFVMGALSLAFRHGDSVFAAGRVSARLLFSLNTAVPAIVAQTGVGFRPIRVRVAQAVDYAPPPPYSRGVAVGFSGGIDSFCVLCDHLGPAVPPAHRLTHLLFNNVGAFGTRGASGFRQRHAGVIDCAQDLRLPVIAVDSNLDEFLGLETFNLEHQFRNIAAALVVQSLIGTYLYASGYRYEDCFVRKPGCHLAAWEPVLLPQLATERLRVLSVGCQYSRVQKIERVAGFAPSRRHLHVCVRSSAPRNCSICWKCARTLLSFEILGLLESFRDAFDLDAYAAVRSRYIVEMLRSDDPLWTEVRDLARERGIRFPATLRLAAALPDRMLQSARRNLPRGLKHQLSGT
ncbi:MAG: hypothetical protein QM691_16980 [Opitutaceae bacterium]